MKVGIVQPLLKHWKWEVLEREAVAHALWFKNKNVDIVCFPELYPGSATKLKEVAKEINSYILCGEVIRLGNRRYKNAVTLINRSGEVEGQYIKIHLTPSEKEFGYIEGNELKTFDTDFGRIGVLICYDFPIDPELTTINALKGIDVLFVPSIASANLLSYWDLFLLSRSIESGVPIVYVNIADFFISNNYRYGGGGSRVIIPINKKLRSLNDFLNVDKELLTKNNIIYKMGLESSKAVVDLDLKQYRQYRNDVLSIRNRAQNLLSDSSYKQEYKITIDYKYDERLNQLRVSVFPDMFYLLECPYRNKILERTLASVCAFITAVNYPIYKDKKVKVTVDATFKVPKLFAEMINDFNTLSKYQEIVFTNVSESIEIVEKNQDNPEPKVVLVSGGKDSISQLLRLIDSGIDEKDIEAVFFHGSIINPESWKEKIAVERITKRLGVKLRTVELSHFNYTSNSCIRVRLRSIWREMLYLPIVRYYSSVIYTGINEDPNFGDNLNMLKNVPGAAYNFSSTGLYLKRYEQLLNAKIYKTPTEIENYVFMKYRHKEIFDLSVSCYNPMQWKCEQSWDKMCSKCRTFQIYDTILAGKKLSDEQITFIKSENWVGYSEILAELEKEDNFITTLLNKYKK